VEWGVYLRYVRPFGLWRRPWRRGRRENRCFSPGCGL